MTLNCTRGNYDGWMDAVTHFHVTAFRCELDHTRAFDHRVQ